MKKQNRGKCKFLRSLTNLFRRKRSTSSSLADEQPEPPFASFPSSKSPLHEEPAKEIKKEDVPHDNNKAQPISKDQRKKQQVEPSKMNTDLDIVKREMGLVNNELVKDKIRIQPVKRLPVRYQQEVVTVHAGQNDKAQKKDLVTHDEEDYCAATASVESDARTNDGSTNEAELSSSSSEPIDKAVKVALVPKKLPQQKPQKRNKVEEKNEEGKISKPEANVNSETVEKPAIILTKTVNDSVKEGFLSPGMAKLSGSYKLTAEARPKLEKTEGTNVNIRYSRSMKEVRQSTVNNIESATGSHLIPVSIKEASINGGRNSVIGDVQGARGSVIAHSREGSNATNKTEITESNSLKAKSSSEIVKGETVMQTSLKKPSKNADQQGDKTKGVNIKSSIEEGKGEAVMQTSLKKPSKNAGSETGSRAVHLDHEGDKTKGVNIRSSTEEGKGESVLQTSLKKPSKNVDQEGDKTKGINVRNSIEEGKGESVMQTSLKKPSKNADQEGDKTKGVNIKSSIEEGKVESVMQTSLKKPSKNTGSETGAKTLAVDHEGVKIKRSADEENKSRVSNKKLEKKQDEVKGEENMRKGLSENENKTQTPTASSLKRDDAKHKNTDDYGMINKRHSAMEIRKTVDKNKETGNAGDVNNKPAVMGNKENGIQEDIKRVSKEIEVDAQKIQDVRSNVFEKQNLQASISDSVNALNRENVKDGKGLVCKTSKELAEKKGNDEKPDRMFPAVPPKGSRKGKEAKNADQQLDNALPKSEIDNQLSGVGKKEGNRDISSVKHKVSTESSEFNLAFQKIRKNPSSDGSSEAKSTPAEASVPAEAVNIDGTDKKVVLENGSLKSVKDVPVMQNPALVDAKSSGSEGGPKVIASDSKIPAIANLKSSVKSHSREASITSNDGKENAEAGKLKSDGALTGPTPPGVKAKIPSPPGVKNVTRVQPTPPENAKTAEVAWVGMARRMSKDYSDKVIQQKIETKNEERKSNHEIEPPEENFERGGTRASVKEMVKKLQKQKQSS